jgi:hypothetical protein
MSFIDDAKAWATMPVPRAGTPDKAQQTFDAMPVHELASLWCALQRVGLRDQTEGTWAVTLYFDRLPHDQPDRALDLVLVVLGTEADKSVVMELNGRLMIALINAHAPRVIERIEAEARRIPRLRWLLGGAYWWTSDDAIKARLEVIADEDAWRADEDAHNTPAATIDFPHLTVAELARVWLDQHGKPYKDHDANWQALCDYERELIETDPDKVLDVILAILAIETNPAVLGLLSAGLLEDVISMEVIDRVEHEAKINERFRELLCGVWYSRVGEELKERLEAIVKKRHTTV